MVDDLIPFMHHRTQQYNALQLVAKDLITQQGTQTDPVLLQKCAEFFVMNGQVEKALDMLAAAHRVRYFLFLNFP